MLIQLAMIMTATAGITEKQSCWCKNVKCNTFICSLLDRGVIEMLDPTLHDKEFYSMYVLVQKKDTRLHLILYLRV